MKKEKSELRNIRFSKLYIFLGLFLFFLIIYRVFLLSTGEIVEGTDLQKMANNRITRQETLYSRRGTIYDVNGNPLAQNISSYTLIAYLSPERTGSSATPKHVVDPEYTADALSKVLDIPKDKLLYYLTKDAYQVELGPKAKNLTELKKDEIAALNLPGIDFIETQQRYYPFGRFASYTVGYAKRKETNSNDSSDNLVGEMGIESYYNNTLTGTNGTKIYQKDRNGYKIAGTKEVIVPAVDGNDVYLTIDSNIQLFVEDAIDKLSKSCKSDFISVMLADAKTGAILASGTYPSFDPNTKNIGSYLNLNISVPFEPGSTMKIYSYMAAMENGVYNGAEKYKSGTFTAKDGTVIGDWNRNGWGNITYDAGFALSSNTAVMNLIDKYMNAEMLREYYKKLGFGNKTGIELSGEASGKINFKYETEILNAGFGQGITTTPIQNIQALTSISNDGVLLKPYIVDRIVSPNGDIIYKGEKTELDRVASTKTVTKMKELMRSVITGNSSTSTGYVYYMKGYDLIAKTGTAQVADENGKGYSSDYVIRGLAGMFPGEDPEVLVYVAVKSKSCKARDVSVMVQSIVKNTSKYLEIYDETKENTQKLKEYKVLSYTNKDLASVTSSLKSNEINYVVLGDGDTIVNQYPKSGEVINKIDKVFLLTNSSKVKMPNIIGYSVKDFYSFINLVNIPFKMEGAGYITSQSIKEGTELNSNLELDVKFSSKY